MKLCPFLLPPLLIVLAILVAPVAASAAGLTVFAAASLTDALKEIGAAWTASGHGPVAFSFASSSTLAQQIEHGAPANVFASADEKWMDDLAKHDGIAADTRADLLGNALVLVEPKAGVKPVAIAAGFAIGAILGPDGRLAVGDPAHVPAGIYAKQALTRLGLWDRVRAHLATADSVRSALLLVERGEAPAGVVYATDAQISKDVAVAGVFPAASHDPIRYPFAVTTSGDTQEARAFLAYLRGDAAQGVFTKCGFAKP
jgi:molybdate transport system substrate-binding protein